MRLVRTKDLLSEDIVPPLPSPKNIGDYYYYIIGDASGGSCIDDVKEGDSTDNNPNMAKEAQINRSIADLAETIQPE